MGLSRCPTQRGPAAGGESADGPPSCPPRALAVAVAPLAGTPFSLASRPWITGRLLERLHDGRRKALTAGVYKRQAFGTAQQDPGREGGLRDGVSSPQDDPPSIMGLLLGFASLGAAVMVAVI